jgi:hydrogenase maturation protease
MNIVLVGVGQSLRSDDGAGMVAVHSWRSKYPWYLGNSNLRVEIEQLPGLALLDLIRDAEAAIIVDAVHSGSPAGTIHHVTLNQLSSNASGANTAHGWGVAETLALGAKLFPEALPPEIILLGIEGERFDPGDTLSPSVQRNLPELIDLIESHIHRLTALG